MAKSFGDNGKTKVGGAVRNARQISHIVNNSHWLGPNFEQNTQNTRKKFRLCNLGVLLNFGRKTDCLRAVNDKFYDKIN